MCLLSLGLSDLSVYYSFFTFLFGLFFFFFVHSPSCSLSSTLLLYLLKTKKRGLCWNLAFCLFVCFAICVVVFIQARLVEA